MSRASPKLHQAPPVVGAGGAPIVVVAYIDGGPRRLTGTVATLSDGASLAAAGEDLVVLLPGRGVNLNVTPPVYGPAASFTAAVGVYTNTQATPLRRRHGMQVRSAGRHVVVIGGQVDVSTDYATGSGVEPGGPNFGMSKQNRALYLLDATGTVHLEGVLLTGTLQYEAFNYNCNPTSNLVWQNIKGEPANGADGQMAGVRYLPILAGTPGSGDHDGGDWFQLNTVPRSIVIDGSHSEFNWFQEFFLKAEAGQTRPDHVWIDNVASWEYEGPGGWLYVNADANGAYCPDFRVGDNVAMQPGYQRYPVADNLTGLRDYRTSLTNNAYPKTGQIAATEGIAADPVVSNPVYLNLDGTTGGRLRTIPVGIERDANRALSIPAPGQGPGPGYISPGYAATSPPVTGGRRLETWVYRAGDGTERRRGRTPRIVETGGYGPVGSYVPGAATSGVPAGTTLIPQGPNLGVTEFRISAPGLYDSLDIGAFVNIKSPGVVLRRCRVRGIAVNDGVGRALIFSADQSYMPLIEDCEVYYEPGMGIADNAARTAAGTYNVNGIQLKGGTVRRCNVHDVSDTVLFYGNSCTVETSWLHDNFHSLADPNWSGGGSHDDGVQIQAGDNHQILGDRIEGGYNGTIIATKDLFAAGTGPDTSNVKIRMNWLGGGVGGAGAPGINLADKGMGHFAGVEITDNQFYPTSRNPGIAALIETTTRNVMVWTNNRWAEGPGTESVTGGALVTASNGGAGT